MNQSHTRNGRREPRTLCIRMTNEVKGMAWIAGTVAAMGLLTHVMLAIR